MLAYITTQKRITPAITSQGRSQLDNWGGGGLIFIYSSSQISKTIDLERN